MAKSLSILFVTSEVAPFAKVGSIADVSYSFPLAVRDTGHDIRVMLPKYGSVSERKNRIHEINRLKDMEIPIGNNSDLATVKSSSISNPRVKVQAYIATNQKYFDAKKGIYGNPKTGEDYVDNDERFLFFNRTVIETCLLLGWFPDIIHCNNWTTALVPALAKELFPEQFANTKFVFTIHDFEEQGVFPLDTFEKTGLPKKVLSKFKHKNMFNFMKAGIAYSDFVTTVGPNYAEEILTDNKYGNGLNKAVKDKKSDFKGILNGLDNWTWNPEKDKQISTNFSNNFNDFKQANKEKLMEACGLEYSETAPVIGMMARLGSNKGFELIIDAAKELFANDLRLVVMCDGNSEFKAPLKKLAKIYPDKISVNVGYDDDLSHKLIAGSDIYLGPSLREPSGLNALHALAYGALPVVRETGSIIDIIKNYNPKTKKGNGFVFSKYTAADMMKAVNKALDLYSNKDEWLKVAVAAIDKDYSWAESVEQYNDIYKQLIKG